MKKFLCNMMLNTIIVLLSVLVGLITGMFINSLFN